MEKLLLHVCCGPCSAGVVETLSKQFTVTGYFYNPNIWPMREYIKRAESAKKAAEAMEIELIPGPYEDALFELRAKDMNMEKEGGKRCLACYELRLEKTAEFARKKCIPVFTTTLSVSPHKNAGAINAIGKKIAKRYNLSFYEADFKTADGFKKSTDLSKKFNLYRQTYCGCRYSTNPTHRS